MAVLLFAGRNPSTNRRIHILPGARKDSTTFPKLPAKEASKPTRGRRIAAEKAQNRNHRPDHNPRIRRRRPGLDVAGTHRYHASLARKARRVPQRPETPTGKRTANEGSPRKPAQTGGDPDIPAAAGPTVPSGRDRRTGLAAGERGQFTARGAHADGRVFAARVAEPESRTRGRTATAFGARSGDQGRAQSGGRATTLAERAARRGRARALVRLEHVAPEPRNHRRGDPTSGRRPHVRRRAAGAGGPAGADDADVGTHAQGGSESLHKIPRVDGAAPAAVATQRGCG